MPERSRHSGCLLQSGKGVKDVGDGIVLALSVAVSICSGLVALLLRQLRSLDSAKERHAREIRDTRSAIARIEGHLDMEPFHYTE